MGSTVLLRRDPWIEALLLYSSSDSSHLKVPPSKCFLCGEKGEWWSSCNGKWALFLTLLKGGDPSEGPLISCPSCLTLLKSVWDLEERLKELRLIFDSAMEKVTKEGSQVTKNTKEKGITGDGSIPNAERIEIKVEDSSDNELEDCFVPVETEFEDFFEPVDDNMLHRENYDDCVGDSSEFQENQDSLQTNIRRSSRVMKSKEVIGDEDTSSDSENSECYENDDVEPSSSDEKSSSSETFEPPKVKRKRKYFSTNGEEGRGIKSKAAVKSDENNFPCSDCGHCFRRKWRKTFHEVVVCKVKCEDNPNLIEECDIPVFKCDKCDYICLECGDFRKHYRRVHSTQENKEATKEIIDKARITLKEILIGGIAVTCRGSRKRKSKKEVDSAVSATAKSVGEDKSLSSSFLEGEGWAHVCSVCGQKFERPNRKLRHEIFKCGVKHSKEYLMKMNFYLLECDQCGEKFHEKPKLIRHYAGHSGIQPFGCSECEETFLLVEALRDHMRSSGHSSGWARPITSKETLDTLAEEPVIIPHTTKRNIRQRSEGKTPDGVFKCRHCDQQFPDKAARAKHTQNKHRSTTDGGICHICGINYKRGLNKHVLLAHEGVKPHECPYCGREFIDARRYKEHISLIHNKDPKIIPPDTGAFPCELCEKIYPTKDKLKLHWKDHAMKFQCEICKCRFRSSYDFRRHQKTHEDRSQSCEKCGKSYAFSHLLKKHNKLQPNCDVIPYTSKVHRHIPFEKLCPFGCGETLKARKIYRKHLKQFHLDQDTVSEEIEKSYAVSLLESERC